MVHGREWSSEGMLLIFPLLFVATTSPFFSDCCPMVVHEVYVFMLLKLNFGQLPSLSVVGHFTLVSAFRTRALLISAGHASFIFMG